MRKLQVREISDEISLRDLQTSWDALVRDEPSRLDGLDATATYAWFDALRHAFAPARYAKVIAVYEGERLVGALPFFSRPRMPFGTDLFAVTTLFGGRVGPLLAEGRTDVLAHLLEQLQRLHPGWMTLSLIVTRGSKCHTQLKTVCDGLGMRVAIEPIPSSPYFPLQATEAEFRRDMSKNLLQTLRTCTSRAAKQGLLQFMELRHDTQSLQHQLELILSIERQSWKQAAGTSITTNKDQEVFYREMFPRLSAAGHLHGMLLFLNGEPIAHNFGILHDRIYCCLKQSMSQQHEKLSPALLLQDELIRRLRLRGVLTFDFMGETEPYKLRWSCKSQLYERLTLTIYNRSPAAALLHWLRKVSSHVLLPSRKRHLRG